MTDRKPDDDWPTICAECRHHRGFWDEYGFDGCVCRVNNKVAQDAHIRCCPEYTDEVEDAQKLCPYFTEEEQ